MITAGIDIGSLTAKGVIIEDNRIMASHITKVKSSPLLSAEMVFEKILHESGIGRRDINSCCTTGYGRYDIPFSDMNMSEISCHGMGAFWSDNSIRSIIDIGGQDCKVISVNDHGMVQNFVMNEKCAAGTGRSLELLAETIGIKLDEIGPLSLKSKGKLEITNKCSIFMELEVMHHMYNGKRKKDLAYSINSAVAKRVIQLSGSVKINDNICITGGVSKNSGIVAVLENLLNKKFTSLKNDPQLMGAIGAAVFAKGNN